MVPRHVQEGASSRAVRAPRAGGPAQGCALAKGAASATSAPPHIRTRAATGGRHPFSPLSSGPPETSFGAGNPPAGCQLLSRPGRAHSKCCSSIFFSIQLQTWGVWRCCCWVGIFWSHLFVCGDDFQLQGCCLQLRQLLKACPGLVRGGKKVEMQISVMSAARRSLPLGLGAASLKASVPSLKQKLEITFCTFQGFLRKQ